MISDVLYEAIQDIREYQEELPRAYDDLHEAIDHVTGSMETLQRFLDTPPQLGHVSDADAPSAARVLSEAVAIAGVPDSSADLCDLCEHENAVLRDDLAPLMTLLLAAGGTRLQQPWFVNSEVPSLLADALLDLGAFYPGGDAQLVLGERNQCHDNASSLDDGLTRRRFTGFALSADDCWRVHSWVVSPTGIIETTEPRTIYYGIRWPAETAEASAAAADSGDRRGLRSVHNPQAEKSEVRGK